ncbi:MAG: hypothetical protein HUJ25_15195 [Crocinitomicaceae bacterium]|nr:hypothetical protein [Crocinitomicaceae bacterium]
MKKFFYLILPVVLAFGCTTEEEPKNRTQQQVVKPQQEETSEIQLKQKEVIDKPFADIDVPFQTFKYNSRRENIIDISSGTQIRIPAEAFEDESGNAIKNGVDIKYREFHDISDIMLSGIKMNTPDGDFESAGMFEIRALKDNQELKLKEGKTIDVEMASYKSGEFNSYALNEETKEWEFIEESKAEPNTRKIEGLAQLDSAEKTVEPVCDIEPAEMQDGDEVFDIDYKLQRHSSLKLFNGAMWKVDGGPEMVERFKRDRKVYNELSLEPTTNCTSFRLTLWNRVNVVDDTNKTRYLVSPVWRGPALNRAKVNFKQRILAFKERVREMQQARRAFEREADLVRKFELKGMGIFNCDKLIDFVKAVPLALVITCQEKIRNWWLITMNKKAAIKFYNPTVPNFRHNPNSTNSVMAVLPNDKIGIITEEQFESAYEAYRKSDDPNKKLELELQVEPEPVADKKAFKNHISRF